MISIVQTTVQPTTIIYLYNNNTWITMLLSISYRTNNKCHSIRNGFKLTYKHNTFLKPEISKRTGVVIYYCKANYHTWFILIKR